MTTSFLGFARLPYELRHAIWESALPSASSKAMEFFIKCLVHLILSQPRDTFFGYGVPTKYDGTIIDDFMRDNPPPYAGLDACPESRVVALKHLNKLLYRQKELGSWLTNPKFPYSDPELILRKREGKFIYRCERITDGFDLTSFVFWKFGRELKPKRTPAASLTAFGEDEQPKETRDLDPMENEEAEEADHRIEDSGGEEFWENDEIFPLSIEGEELLPWDDDSDSEDSAVPQTDLEDVPATQSVRNEETIEVLKHQPKDKSPSGDSGIKRKRKGEESDEGDENNQPVRKRQRL
ncbi:hypothetical protein IFR05_014978 [Cadophora sp. M221]|nr:hypothetical protein IFR05_014978 [Cadophora sp. M221]